MAITAFKFNRNSNTKNLRIYCTSNSQDFEQARGHWLSMVKKGYFDLLGILIALYEKNDIHLYEDLITIYGCALATDDPVEHLNVISLVGSQKLKFVTWKVLNKLE